MPARLVALIAAALTLAPTSAAASLFGPPAASAKPASSAAPERAATWQPLAGVVVGIDPGHNGRNWAHPRYLQQQVWNGREWEDCDTTGTSTNGGYPEPKFTWRVSRFLRRDLRKRGAKVVMTRDSNTGHGPCVDRRAKILNHADSKVAIDIHADGGPSDGRGFTILEPVRDHVNRHVIRRSALLGRYVRRSLLARTSMPTSDYYGHRGIAKRNDLAGLNLAREPKVLVECGNMRNSTDAGKLVSGGFQHRLAHAMAVALTRFVNR